MGDRPVNWSHDHESYPGSGNGQYHQDAEYWGPPGDAEYGDERQRQRNGRQPGPAQTYGRQPFQPRDTSTRVELWHASELHPGPVPDERHHGASGADTRNPAWQQAATEQDVWVYREPARADEARLAPPRPLNGAPRRPMIAPPPGSQGRSERPQPMSDQRPQPRSDQRPPEDTRFSVAWVTVIVACTLLGVGLVGLADHSALHGGTLTHSIYEFFSGLFLILMPTAMRIVMRKTARMERFMLVIWLGVAFYVVKVLEGSGSFIFNDEYIHLRNTQDILASGHLFSYNPLLTTASYYPGLAAITSTLVDLTGLSIVACGMIVIGVARLVISASLYFVAERVTGSSRGAGVASLLYATNSMFLFWSVQFAYEDLALPLVFFTVWWLSRTRAIRGRRAAQGITVVAIVAVTITHHVSAFALCGVLTTLYIAERRLGAPASTRRYVGAFAALSGVLAAFWFFVVAKPAFSYLLGQNFTPAIQGVISTIKGKGGGRTLYGDPTAAPPKWWVYVGFTAILLIMGALLPAAIRAWRVMRARGAASPARRAAIAVAAITAIVFPLTLLPRFTADGTAISARTSELIFCAIGCAVGLLWGEVRLPAGRAVQWVHRLVPIGWFRDLLATSLLWLVFVGQVSIGTSFFTLLPASTVGFQVYVQPYMISNAEWARQHLGPNQVFAADDINTLALAGFGDENPVSGNNIFPIFYDSRMSDVVVTFIKQYHIHYVQLDWLTTKEQPVKPGGVYYSSLEPINTIHGGPIPLVYFNKFSAYTCSSLVHQSGSIQIYDVSKIADGSCVPHRISVPSTTPTAKKSTKAKATS